MPSTSVKLTPGVNTVKTPSLNEAGISTSNLIRFREGLIEKLGGWVRYFSTAVATVPRGLWPWRDFQNTTFLAVGSTSRLQVIANGTLTDITPRKLRTASGQTLTSGGNSTSGSVVVNSALIVVDPAYTPIVTELVQIEDLIAINGLSIHGSYPVIQTSVIGYPSNSYALLIQPSVGFSNNSAISSINYPVYSTIAGSNIVNVNLALHGLVVGNTFVINNAVNVGGLTLVGNQTIGKIVDVNNFSINFDAAATSTGSATGSGGQVKLDYNPSNPYGSSLKGSQITTKDWSLGNYGQILIACAFQSAIYQWQTNGPSQTATIISGSPLATGIIISDAAQQIIAYGGDPLSAYDPNYVAWSDTGNINSWLAAVGNQAGSYRIPTGSGVVGGAAVASNIIMLWTDVDAWAMQYVGYPIIYGFTKLATGCGLISQFAWARLGGFTFCMSQKRFWVYDGNSVQPLDCPIYDNVFPLISQANAWKIRGGTNSAFNEAIWFFPSTSGLGENDMYVKLNPIEGTWDYGTLARSAWTDQSIAGPPIAASPTGLIYQHETSPDADGVAMTPSFTTGLFQVSEGEDFVFIDWMRPDFKFKDGIGTIQVSVMTYNYVGDTPTVAGPFSFTAATQYINMRCRGRYVALQFSSSDLGSFWRAGRTQVRFAPDGRR